MLLTLLDLKMLVITSVSSSLINFVYVVDWLVGRVAEGCLWLVVYWSWLEYCSLLVDKLALVIVVGGWFVWLLLFHHVLRAGCC